MRGMFHIAVLLALQTGSALGAEEEQITKDKQGGAVMTMRAETRRVELGMAEIEMEIRIAAAPERVFEAFINETGRWWSKDFIMGGPQTNDIVIEAQPGGRLLEKFTNGGGNVWAVVMGIDPGKSIRMGIPDGVLWSGAGTFSLRFEPDGEGTLVKLSHSALQRYSEDEHSGYVQGWETLIGAGLKSYVEQGSVANSVR